MENEKLKIAPVLSAKSKIRNLVFIKREEATPLLEVTNGKIKYEEDAGLRRLCEDLQALLNKRFEKNTGGTKFYIGATLESSNDSGGIETGLTVRLGGEEPIATEAYEYASDLLNTFKDDSANVSNQDLFPVEKVELEKSMQEQLQADRKLAEPGSERYTLRQSDGETTEFDIDIPAKTRVDEMTWTSIELQIQILSTLFDKGVAFGTILGPLAANSRKQQETAGNSRKNLESEMQIESSFSTELADKPITLDEISEALIRQLLVWKFVSTPGEQLDLTDYKDRQATTFDVPIIVDVRRDTDGRLSGDLLHVSPPPLLEQEVMRLFSDLMAANESNGEKPSTAASDAGQKLG